MGAPVIGASKQTDGLEHAGEVQTTDGGIDITSGAHEQIGSVGLGYHPLKRKARLEQQERRRHRRPANQHG